MTVFLHQKWEITEFEHGLCLCHLYNKISYRNVCRTAKQVVQRVGKPPRGGSCYVPSSQRQRVFTGGWTKDTTHRRKWKRIFDIWWRNNTVLNLYWQGLEIQGVFYYFSATLGRFVWFFHQNPAAQFALPEGGSCWERDWETRICQRVVLFPTALADWPKSYEKKKKPKKKIKFRKKPWTCQGFWNKWHNRFFL